MHKKPSFASLAILTLLLSAFILSACGEDTGNAASAQNVTAILPGAIQANSGTTSNSADNAANLKAATTTAAGTKPVTTNSITPPPDSIPFTWGNKGKVWDQYFQSDILDRRMSYRIYLPPDYYTNTTKSYPVLYMLHGLAGNYQEWVDYGLLPTADDMIVAGQLKSLIIVLPQGDTGYWMNWANNGPRWADYLAEDVVDHVDSHYRTIANRDNRAIGGHSMGGHGAMQVGLNHTDEFGIIGAFSPTLRTLGQAFYYWGDAAYYATIDPVSLARTKDLSGVKLWLDIGEQDTEWRPRTEELRDVFTQRKANLTWHLWPGGHGGEYWIAHVKDYLNFFTSQFTLA